LKNAALATWDENFSCRLYAPFSVRRSLSWPWITACAEKGRRASRPWEDVLCPSITNRIENAILAKSREKVLRKFFAGCKKARQD
jgi:hypothetical protein